MTFSNSSFFAGIGTAFAAIAVGFAGGAIITNNAVQPPNRLERVNAGTTVGSNSSATQSTVASNPDQSRTPASPAQDAAAPAVAATASPPAADAQPGPQPPPAPAAPAKTDAVRNVQEQPKSASATKDTPPPAAGKSDEAAGAKDRADTRSADTGRETYRKRSERRYSERKRRQQEQDSRRLDEAANVVRQMQRGEPADETSGRDDAPRFGARSRRFEAFRDDNSPRVVNEPPPRFGLFGGND